MDPSRSSRKSRTTGQTQVVFVRLDPLLQRLLKLVTRYQEIVEKTNSDSSRENELLVEAIKSQIEVLDQVQQAFEQFGPTFAPSLIVLADYVSLPLTAIFHIKTPIILTDDNESESTRRGQIRRSYIHKLYLSTAKTIQCYVRACSDPSTDSKDQLPVSLTSQHLIKFLIALTNALPSDAELSKTSGNSLDDGSELWIALLSTITTIVCVCKDDISEAWDGTLVARIVDCTTSLSNSPKQDVSLQSLQTLQSLLEASSKPTLWQSIFPGVFASLYRRLMSIHRQTSAGLSVSIECQALSILTDLFRVALVPLASDDGKKETKSAKALLHQLESIARKSQVAPPEVVEEDSTFLSQVKKRVVAPLCLLLRQEAISSSEKVRMHVASLCQVLLIDTRECWKTTKMQELSVEICLILETDPEVHVGSHAAAVIQEYQEQSDIIDFSRMVSRTLSLMEELPALAQGSKKVEMRMQLQLLTGYLQTVGTKASPAIAASMAMRRSLIQLMDIDFNSASTRVLATPIDMHQGSELDFRWLDSEIAMLSRKMLTVLGKILGIKHGSILVDALISDFYEASMEQVSSFGAAHIEWLHELIGSLVIAKEIFIGAFSVDKVADAGPKQERRRKRVLQSLASSLLPLLVNSSLWNLPTIVRADCGDQQLLSPRSLYGNGCVSVLLLEFIASFCEFLGRDVDKCISSVLYPIVEKASRGNVPMIQRTALRAVDVIATSRGFSDLSGFLRHEFNTLMACMSGRLRLPGGVQVPGDSELEDTLAVSASARWVLENAVQNISECTSWSDRTATSSMINLITLLVERFDHLFLRQIISEDDVHDLTLVYKSTFGYFLTTFGASNDTMYSYRMKTAGNCFSQSWLDFLSPFRKVSLDGFHVLAPEELSSDSMDSGQNGISEKSLDVSMAEVNFLSKLITRGCYFLSHKNLGVRISTCDSLTSGFRFLAFVACKYEDPDDEESNIRNSILRQVASSWPSIKARLLTVSEEIIESTTLTKSKRLGSLFITRPVNVPSSSPTQEVATQRIFLTKVLTLIATMCECSGDFMADRFKNDVWSVIARHLGNLFEKQESKDRLLEKRFENKLRIQTLENTVSARSTTSNCWSDSERRLILAILQCLSRVFQHEDCGLALSSILASAGSMLLPLLEDNDQEIVGCAMQALKNIAMIDCDVLWRPLLQLSGRGIPRCPLRNLCYNTNKVRQSEVIQQSSLSKQQESDLALRCQELMAYIESLPEQPL